jgi:acetyl esterase/lipase
MEPAILLGLLALALAQTETIPLTPDGAAALTVYLPAGGAVARSGVVVCPGGGYARLAMDHEGRQVAEWLNSLGVAAFVLKYRVGPAHRHPIPLQDAQEALRVVRRRAAEIGVAPDRVGIWGFSAGGHLAATAATHFTEPATRPDFLILGYPVITMQAPYLHRGSRDNLLGPDPPVTLAESLSLDKAVSARTPPSFLFHTNEDTGVPAENSVMFYLALRKAGVPAELHIYERGRHGVGLAAQDPVLSTWAARLADWLRLRGLVPPSQKP